MCVCVYVMYFTSKAKNNDQMKIKCTKIPNHKTLSIQHCLPERQANTSTPLHKHTSQGETLFIRQQIHMYRLHIFSQ